MDFQQIHSRHSDERENENAFKSSCDSIFIQQDFLKASACYNGEIDDEDLDISPVELAYLLERRAICLELLGIYNPNNPVTYIYNTHMEFGF